MSTTKCPRCWGIGTIREFKNVLAGRCFKCHGTGRLHATKFRRGFRFVIIFRNRVTGSQDNIYTIKAANAAQALKMAGAIYQGASTAIKETYSMEAVAAVREDELKGSPDAKAAPAVPEKQLLAEKPINHRDRAESSLGPNSR